MSNDWMTERHKALWSLLEGRGCVPVVTLCEGYYKVTEFSTRRQAQQRIGNRISLFNRDAAKASSRLRIKPGIIKGTYFLTEA